MDTCLRPKRAAQLLQDLALLHRLRRHSGRKWEMLALQRQSFLCLADIVFVKADVCCAGSTSNEALSSGR